MKLRTGYLLLGIFTGLVLLFSFFTALPDGKLHLVFCNVGQGDGAYIRFPDGRDMVVDGGPDDKILNCLGRHMPFWDRHIDLVAMTHPQKDHFYGLISVLERFKVDYFVRSDVDNTTESYGKLLAVVKERRVPVRFMTAPATVDVGSVRLAFLWPSKAQIAKGKDVKMHAQAQGLGTDVLGSSTGSSVVGDLNDYCLVFLLRYGIFDALFTGDADSRVEPYYQGSKLPDDTLEVLKVPHHGSRTGMTAEFLSWLKPKLAVISVGHNNYGHPAAEALAALKAVGSRIMRTDQAGDIEVISDGNGWEVKTEDSKRAR